MLSKKEQITLFENYIKYIFDDRVPYIQIVSNSTIDKGILLKPDNSQMKSFDLFVVRYGLMITTVSFHIYISKNFKRMALVFYKFGNPNIVYKQFKYCMIVNTDNIIQDITKFYDTELEEELRKYFENFPNDNFFNPKEDSHEIYFINNFPFGVIANNFNTYISKQFKCFIRDTTRTYDQNTDEFKNITKESILTSKVYMSYKTDCNFILTIFDNKIYIIPKQDFIECRENPFITYKILSL